MESAIRSARISAYVPDVAWNMNVFQRLLVGVAVLDIGIQVDTYLLYQEYWATYGAIGGINISIATLCLGVLYALWLVQAGATAAYRRLEPLYVNWPLTLYFGIICLSALVAENKLLSLNTIWLLGQSYLLFTYIANQTRTRSDIVFIVSLLALSLAVQGAIMIGVRIVGHDVALGPVAVKMDDGRVGGTIGSPVTGGSYLALLIAPTLSLLLMPVSRATKLLALVAIALGGAALVLTFTRGSWIATGFSVSLFFALAWLRGWISLGPPLACAFLGLIVAAAFSNSIFSRFNDDDGSAQARPPLFRMAAQMIADNPLTGVGTNNCAVSAQEYATSPEMRGEWFWTIHNKYLLEAVETGVFGLAAFLLFLGTTIYTGWRTWLRADRLLAPISLAIILAICGMMTHMMVDVFSSRAQVQSLWLCAAIVVAASRVKED